MLVTRLRIPTFLIICLLIVPSFLAQRSNDFVFGSSTALSMSRGEGQDTTAINELFGLSNQAVILVPRGEWATENALTDELADISDVTAVISYGTMIGSEIPPEFVGPKIADRFLSEITAG